MTRAEEIVPVLFRILETGLLRARSAAWAGNAARSADEIDHIHNLPTLIESISDERLRAYWDGDRTAFLSRYPDAVMAFGPLWDRVRSAVDDDNG